MLEIDAKGLYRMCSSSRWAAVGVDADVEKSGRKAGREVDILVAEPDS
jgi:hypothetical protein